ncbi:hypothetical protein Poli38472_005507 [Pythium oligandrum]|uniref:cGMP-dependent protein kinase n=1 Tax=Pythium oligandrum TaxID=41045 RepID=A0A8K1CG45_PYTOL|nr:hypothetical protein Poli38472_005507 [Pythium oligandrum]|eukprot:TMW62889.1 hypothetical protein Poli38472_005507 [Pythium oligandrum]
MSKRAVTSRVHHVLTTARNASSSRRPRCGDRFGQLRNVQTIQRGYSQNQDVNGGQWLALAAGVSALTVAAMAGRNDTSETYAQSSMVTMHPIGSSMAIDEVYEITDEIIGEGGYCVVRRGIDRHTGEAVAVKILSKSETPAREFWTEVDVLRTAGHHPNIMQLRGVFENEENWYIVQELASEGELFDHLIENGAYSEQQASAAIRELCDALHYLHRKGIVHGDIKPENILLHNGRMCLVDFGVSFRLGEQFFADAQLTGTVAYAAPETLLHSVPHVQGGFESEAEYSLGPSADMFALGIVLYILLCGSHPFDPYNNLTDEEIRHRIIKGKFSRHTRAWQSISPPARDLIEKLLQPDTEKRLTSAEAMMHPWLAKNAELSQEPIRNSAELLERFQRGRRRLRASILGVLLLDALDDDEQDEHIKKLSAIAKEITWGVSSSVEALSEKAGVLMSTLDVFDREKKGFITKTDLARVSEKLGRPLTETELNEMLIGATGDPEQKASSIKAIGYDDVKLAISTLRSASFNPGDVIIREGQTGNHVYLLLDGEVDVSCKNPITPSSPKSTKNPAREGFGGLLNRTRASTAKEQKKEQDVSLQRLQKGSFFGAIELLRPEGELHPRIATYTCAPDSSCKVLQLVADDFLNVSGLYSSLNQKVKANARIHTQEQLIKCVEAMKGSVKKHTYQPGEFVYHEGESCDSFFIIMEGEVQVLQQREQVVVEELRTGDYFPLGVSGQTSNCMINTRHYSVRCTQPTRVIEIGGETFRSFLHSNQFMASYFRQEIIGREQMRDKTHTARLSK